MLCYIKQYYKYLIIVIIFLLVLSGGYMCYRLRSNDKLVVDDTIAYIETSVESTSKLIDNFYIDIKGSVNNPGVYLVSDGMIVADAITLAGGLKNNAYTDNINLAMKLCNEMVIYIYSKSEMTSKVITSIKNDALVITTTTKGIIKDVKVNINSASLEELMTISGIGEGKAKAIISYRENNKFEIIEDIKNVSGIGDSLFEQIKDNITV